MPIAAIGVGLGTALAGAAAGGATIYGAHKMSSGADRAARLQTDAATQAAQIQAKSQADALAFQKQQAQQAWQSGETDRRANYDQWAARERRLGSVGELLGYGGRSIPGYVPSVNPNLTPQGQQSVGQTLASPTQMVIGPDGRPRPMNAPRQSVGQMLAGRRA